MALAVAAVFLLALSAARAEICPSVCYCFPNHEDNTLTVDCRNQDLFEIPYPLPNTTTHLDVSNNLIQFIREADFWPGLTKLKFLQLQNNDLIDLQPGAFRRVPTLEVLTLYNNRIRQLVPGVFDGLSNLQILDAHSNGIQELQPGVFSPLENIVKIDLSLNSIESISMGTFSGLQRLQRLFLSDNALTTIEEFAIANLTSLTYLNLEYNKLAKIPQDAFFNLPRIRTLVLRGNPLECGCCAVWLAEFFSANRLSSPVCETPQQFAGFQLLSLDIDEFCRLPEAEVMPGDDVILNVGNTLQLTCAISGVPMPVVTWSRNGMTLDLSDSRLSILGPSLQLVSVTENDTGIYYCSAFSSAGRVASSVRVTVINGEAMNSTITPAVAGEDVTLNCSADLPLGVQVMWSFNSMTLTTSNKYSIDSNGALLIRNVGVADMGDYFCTAGDVVLLRMLDISAAPVIVEFPEGECENPSLVRINSIMPYQLNCSAFGIPAPTVQWIYMGNVLATAHPPEGMVGGVVMATVEIVMPSPEENDGVYTCVANNSINSTERMFQLVVRVFTSGIQPPLLELTLFAGRTAVMECLLQPLDPDEIESVEWRRFDGLPFSPDRVTFAGLFNTTLIIENVMPFVDTAQYTCLIITTTNMRLGVSYQLSIFEPPVITRECPVPVITALVGTNVSLLCDGRGIPRLSWQWTANGLPLEDFLPPNRTTFDPSLPFLNISFAQSSDSGIYNCTVSNIISIEGSGISQNFTDSYAIELRVQRLPFFAYQPQSQAITAGETLQLQCVGRGDPAPNLTWWRRINETEVEEVKSDGRVLISDESLVFLETIPSDEGTYFCRISSPLMTLDSVDAFLRVYTAPSLEPTLPIEYRVLVGAVNFTLECTGSGDPEPVISWLKDEEILPVTGEHVQLANGSLVILEVAAEDAGLYMCRVANVGGMTYLMVNLIVRDFPATMVEPQLVTVDTGCQAVFFCSDAGMVPAEMKWSFNGEELDSGPGVDILPSGQLILSNVQTSQSGNYTCSIWGPPGDASDTAELEVLGPSASPPTIFTPTPSMQIIALGQTAQFVCLAGGVPQPEVIWLRNGSPQPNFRRVEITERTLTIEQLVITDQATYECMATNTEGTATQMFQLLLSSPPDFVLRPESKTIVEGDILTLNCSATGPPHDTPTVSWFMNDTELISDGRRIVDPLTNGLSVFNTLTNDSGVYSCVATNLAGTSEYAVPVTVEMSMVAPNITSPPENVVAAVGMDVFLDCLATGFPPPTITWLRNREPIPACGETMDNVCVDESVIITGAQEENEGVYSCIAENSLGRHVYDVTVAVGTAPSMDLPFFTVFPRPVWVINGSDIIIDCQAGGSPPPMIDWLKDFMNLTDATTVVLPNGSLFIPDAQEEDTGFYTCRADNGIGVNQVSIGVDIFNESPVGLSEAEHEAPNLVMFPSATLTLLPQTSTLLDCVATGYPPPTISWLKDGLLVNSSFSDSLTLLMNGSLLLSEVSQNDSGHYICRANNSLGSAQVHVVVDVVGGVATGAGDGGAPVFRVAPAEETVVLSGSSVELQCGATGHPLPYVLWTQDNKPVYERDGLRVTNTSVVISEASFTHSGHYQCLAMNIHGEAHTDVTLTVLPRKEPPYFTTVPPRELIIKKRTHLVVPCHAHSWDGEITNVQWYYEGQRSTPLLGDGNLVVLNARSSNAGTYTCVASNKYGTSSAATIVTVTKMAVDANVTAKLGSSTEIECALNGTGIVWKQNGRGVSSVSSRLFSIPEVQLRHQGEYTCSHGDNSVNYFLYVQVLPEIVKGSGGQVFTRENQTAELECQATGKPHPSISWYHNGHQLERDGKYRVLSNGSLLVHRVTAEDSGAYVCVAENLAGRAETSVDLILIA